MLTGVQLFALLEQRQDARPIYLNAMIVILMLQKEAVLNVSRILIALAHLCNAQLIMFASKLNAKIIMIKWNALMTQDVSS